MAIGDPPQYRPPTVTCAPTEVACEWNRKVMTCAYCGWRKDWSDGFPDRTYAKCWGCSWADHVAQEHAEKRSLRSIISALWRKAQGQ